MHAAVLEDDLDQICSADDVLVGDDMSVGVHDQAGTEALLSGAVVVFDDHEDLDDAGDDAFSGDAKFVVLGVEGVGDCGFDGGADFVEADAVVIESEADEEGDDRPRHDGGQCRGPDGRWWGRKPHLASRGPRNAGTAARRASSERSVYNGSYSKGAGRR